ncbi:MAG TPA: hypothetical protein VD963_01970 [Phycisphaerales bacterium]|nr:hypothetical protein [Phycisphaerales bacterium]
MALTKTLVRVGVVGGIVTVAAVAVAGPHRLCAVVGQARSSINETIDTAVGDPVALRAQLRDLEGQYPKRISAVRADLAQLREQIGQLRHEQAVAARVVALAQSDHQTLTAQLDRAGEALIQTASYDSESPEVVVVFKSERLPVAAARVKCEQIIATENAYSQRAADIERDLGYLTQQESRLASLVNKLETERTTFQAELWQLERKVDAVARNERMIQIMERRQAMLTEHERYRGTSLDNVKTKLGERLAAQESRLESLAGTTQQENYEQQAKLEISRQALAPRVPAEADRPARPAKHIIEIHPQEGPQPEPAPAVEKSAESLASRTPAQR